MSQCQWDMFINRKLVLIGYTAYILVNQKFTNCIITYKNWQIHWLSDINSNTAQNSTTRVSEIAPCTSLEHKLLITNWLPYSFLFLSFFIWQLKILHWRHQIGTVLSDNIESLSIAKIVQISIWCITKYLFRQPNLEKYSLLISAKVSLQVYMHNLKKKAQTSQTFWSGDLFSFQSHHFQISATLCAYAHVLVQIF